MIDVRGVIDGMRSAHPELADIFDHLVERVEALEAAGVEAAGAAGLEGRLQQVENAVGEVKNAVSAVKDTVTAVTGQVANLKQQQQT